MRKRKNAGSFLFMLLTALGLLTGIVEISARMVLPDYQAATAIPASRFEYDATLGWKGARGASAETPVTHAGIVFNAQGFRDEDFQKKSDRAKKSHGKKFLFLGDSYLFGHLIPERDRLTEQLERLFHEEGETIVTFNSAIPDFGTGQQARAFENLFSRIDPDIVFLQLTLDDFADSALPFDFRQPDYRYYKPYYDLDGNLVLNETVPEIFSRRVRDGFFGNFRSKYLIDKIQYLFDSVRYSRLGVDDPAKFPPRSEIFATIGEWYRSANFKTIFDRNKTRNFNLIEKMARQTGKAGKRFIVLTPFGPTPDAASTLDDVSNQVLGFFDRNGIEHLPLEKDLPSSLRKCSRLLDGQEHPNFLANYYAALAVHNILRQSGTPANFDKTSWYSALPREIDFLKDNNSLYLFGDWYPPEILKNRKSRWMGESASFLIQKPGRAKRYILIVEGGTFFPITGLTVENARGEVVGQAAIPESNRFKLKIKLDGSDEGLNCLTLKANETFIPQGDARKLSLFINKIKTVPVSSTPTKTLYLRGTVPPGQWNRLGKTLILKLGEKAAGLKLGIDFSITLDPRDLEKTKKELLQTLLDLDLDDQIKIAEAVESGN